MLSRVANSVYWMSRYVERAENVARFLDVNHNLTLGDASLAGQWAPLVYITGDQDAFEERYGEATRANVLQFLAFDEVNPNSILSCVAIARENARTVREMISVSMWEQINKFYLMVQSAARSPASLQMVQEFCDRVKLANHTLTGQTYATMSRGEAWHFSNIGRLIERADKTSRIVDVQYYLLLPNPQDVGTTLDAVRWSALLKSTSALEMYRREHGRIVPQKVADFLVLNRAFPRSIHFCLVHAEESLRQITGSSTGTFGCLSEQLMGRLRAELDYTRIEDVIDNGLHQYIDRFQTQLNRVGGAILGDFFTNTRVAEAAALRERA